MIHQPKRILPAFLCWIFLCILACFFIPECDDLYFQYWEYDSLLDFLLTSPAQSDAAGVPQNGRYLGNTLGVVMSKLQFYGLDALRALFLGSCLFCLCLLAGGYGRPEGFRHRFVLGFAALMLCPVVLWKEVLSWSASFCNYLVPVLFLLAQLRYFRQEDASPLRSAGFLAAAFLGQLFSETMTAFFLMLDALLCLVSILRRDRPRLLRSMCLLLGAGLGALLMFSDPGYGQLEQDPLGRSIGLSGAKDTLFSVLSDTLFENIFFLCAAGLLFRKKFRNDRRPWVRAGVLTLCLTALACLILSLAGRVGFIAPLSLRLILCLCAVGALLALYCALSRGETKLWIGIWILCYLGMTLVLMLINPISPRHYFLHYMLLFLALLELYNETGWLPFRSVLVPSIAAGICLLLIYHANFSLERQRVRLIHDAMANGRTELTLPLVPYPQYTVNETTAKGDVSFIYYYESPWDLQFHFIPYREWLP